MGFLDRQEPLQTDSKRPFLRPPDLTCSPVGMQSHTCTTHGSEWILTHCGLLGPAWIPVLSHDMVCAWHGHFLGKIVTLQKMETACLWTTEGM